MAFVESDETLKALLEAARTVAVVGIKDRESEDAFRIPQYLQKAGYRIVPVNPKLASVLNEPCKRSLTEVEGPIDIVNLFRAQRQILYRFEIEKGPKVAEVVVRMPSGKEQVQEIFNDTVIGYNKFDKEVVRVTIDEPIIERPGEKHANSI